MLVVDTSVWLDLFADRDTSQVAHLSRVSAQEEVGVGDLVLCEVLQGARTEAQRRRLVGSLLCCELVEMVGVQNAMAAADNYRALRTMGITVRGAIDCLIATYCIRNGLPLLHNDRDFDPFEQHLGLQVVR
jgi:predicted nucleic acid-binding protein